MSIYDTQSISSLLSENAYPGRGIITGMSDDGKYAVCAYFIMGRSVNSRNRVFEKTEDGIRTRAFDPSLMKDPSLIIYAPVRTFGKAVITTNGDQTDTIRDELARGGTFDSALKTREFEPDAPNFTPRISAIQYTGNGYRYSMSILKSADAEGSACNRFTYNYAPVPGVGHFIHTYNTDGNPLPSFTGEPRRVAIVGDIDQVTEEVWNNLNEENKISLYVRFVNLETGEADDRLINKNV